ncbi:MAG: hypothetical protein ABIJ86_17150 [Spirochaetota bacterium]
MGCLVLRVSRASRYQHSGILPDEGTSGQHPDAPFGVLKPAVDRGLLEGGGGDKPVDRRLFYGLPVAFIAQVAHQSQGDDRKQHKENHKF